MPTAFTEGDRITWNTHGRDHTGKIIRIVVQEETFHHPGELIVEADKPDYPHQTVCVFPQNARLIENARP